MNRRAFLTRLTWTVGTLALAACRSAAPSTMPAPPTATAPPTSAGQPPASAAAGSAVAQGASVTPSTPALVATATRIPSPAPPTSGAVTGVTSTAPPGPPDARSMPLFDTHVHYSQDAWGPIPIPQALALLDLAGTRVAMVSSTPDEGTIRLLQAAPARIIPILRPYRTSADMGTWHSDPSIPPYLEERLALGVHRGFGEFHLYGDDARSAVVGQVLQFTGQRRLLLHAHADARAIEHLFDRDPTARILWAHAGYADPATLARMVERYPQLWVETAIRGEIGPGGHLDPAWRDLFLAYPDRFMIGTDSYIVPRWVSMPTILGDVRAWCRSLPAPVGEQVAWRNAARLMGVNEVPFRGD
jgi:hypothetical protein